MKPSMASRSRERARFGLVIDRIATQLGLIRTLRGLDADIWLPLTMRSLMSVGSSAVLPANPDLARAEFWYWIRKLQARFFAGDYASAIEASSRAQRLLWTSTGTFEMAEYHFYGALSHAACLRFRGNRRAPAAPGRGRGPSQATPDLGGELSGEFREPRRAGRRRDRPPGGPRSGGQATSTKRPSVRPAPMALSTTKHSPTNWLRASTRRVGSRGSLMYVCRTPATATSVGEPPARCGNSISCIRGSGRRSRSPGRQARSGRRSNTSTSRP